MNAPRFKYYLEGLPGDKPEPIFHLWIESAKGFSDVSGETVLAARGSNGSSRKSVGTVND